MLLPKIVPASDCAYVHLGTLKSYILLLSVITLSSFYHTFLLFFVVYKSITGWPKEKVRLDRINLGYCEIRPPLFVRCCSSYLVSIILSLARHAAHARIICVTWFSSTSSSPRWKLESKWRTTSCMQMIKGERRRHNRKWTWTNVVTWSTYGLLSLGLNLCCTICRRVVVTPDVCNFIVTTTDYVNV